MQNINFNDNLKTFSINNDESRTITINTADIGILERLEKSQKILENLQSEAQKAENTKDDLEYSILGEIDRQIKEQINYIFGSDVSTPAFGTACCYSFCNGKPLFENFLDALMPIIQADTEKETKQMQANIEKYTKQLPQITK